MDIKQLLEKMDQFAGQAVGQKPGDQWRGTDSAPPGKKLVGDSILKDLQKGLTPKNREQELSEEFEAFLQALEEENLGTHPKRPGRKSDRHARGHEPLPRYKTVKADEAVGKGVDYHNQIPIKSVIQGLNVDYNRKTNQTVLSYRGQPVETFIYDGIPVIGHFKVAVDHKVAGLMKSGKIPKMPSPPRNSSSQPQTYNLDQEYSHGIDLPKNVQQQMFQQHDQDTENYGMVSVSNPAKWANINAKKEKEKEKQQKVAESMSDKDIELQDYRLMSDKEFQNAYKMTKTEWINKNKSIVIKNPDIKKGLGLDEGADTEYTVNMDRNGKTRSTSGTIAELLDYFGYTLEVGKSYEHEKGRYKINLNPKSIGQLVDALNKAASNGAANGAASTHYSTGGQMFDEAANPAQQAAIAIAMKKAGKKPKQVDESDEGISEDSLMDMIYDILSERPRLGDNAVIKLCKQYVEEDGDTFTNDDIVRIKQLLPSVRQDIRQSNLGEAYKATNPHPALQDPIVAKVVKQMRPGLKNLDMNNEAFLYFAYEIGKMRAREMWEDYGPAIKYFYQSGIGVNEGWESGPEEYEEPYDDADDAYDRQRQEKIDTEAEKEWAKLPKVSTYQCTGRGANMEPNQKFGPEFDTLEKALEYRAEIMKDPKTPHPKHIGINTLTRVTDQTNETVEGGGGVKDLNDYTTKRDYIYKQLADPKQRDNYPHFKQALFDLMRTAREKGIKIEESRAHKQLDTWFKNRELADKFARGEVKIPTPQERKTQLEKPKKQIKEFGADAMSGATGQSALSQTNTVDPKQAQAITQATSALKSATQSSAPAPMIAKALDAASQGKPVGQQDMKALEPLMKDVATVAQEPKLATQFKTLAQQIQQTQQKQQQKTA